MKCYSLSDRLKHLMSIPSNIFWYTLYFISFIIPRRKDIWVFGSWSGKRFSDNSKYMFLYMANNHKDITSVWISRDRNIIKKLRDHQYNAYHIYEPRGIYYNLRAGYIFSDSYFNSVNFWCCGGAKKIQLWHGKSLKKIEHDAKLPWNKSIFSKCIYRYMTPWLFVNYDYIVTSSDFFIDILTSAFRIEKERILITGYPRNDNMFCAVNGDNIIDTHIYDNIIKLRNSRSKIILYAPTFRDYNINNPFTGINLDFEKLNSFLESINCFLIIKLHPNIDMDVDIKTNHNRIIFLPNKFDIYQLLYHIDILITDYSSIYIDFLLTNKPIIFFPHDLEKYLKEERGFYLDYQKFSPGPIVFTLKDLLYWIDYFARKDENKDENKKNENDKFTYLRKKIRDLFFNHTDGRSAERIYNYISNLA